MKSGYSWSLVGSLPPGDLMSPHLSGQQGDLKRVFCHLRSLSAVDMRQLTQALAEAQEGTGEVRAVLLHAAFKPRLPGLTKMVSKLSKEGGWRKALEVYETVEEMGMIPDTALTNAAISACDKGGRWQKALEIFESMDRLHLPRDAITYSATISSLAKGKQWHAALQVFDHMRSSGVPADVVTCCSLINALEKGGQWQLAEALFVQMCAGAAPEAKPLGEVSPSSVLDALLHFSGKDGEEGARAGADSAAASPGGPGARAGELEEELAAQLQSSLALDAAGGANPFATAAFITSSIRRSASEIGPRGPSLAGLLGASGLERSLSGTGAHGRRSVSSVHDARASTHLRRALTSFSRGDGSQAGSPVEPELGEGPAALLASARECFAHAARVTPNRVCCNALLAAYARARPPQWEKALHLLRAMWEGSVPSLTPDAVSFNTVLKACAGAGRLTQVNEVFHEMLHRGIRPNVTTFNCLIGAASDAGDPELLRQVGSWLDGAERDIRQACVPVFLTASAKLNSRAGGGYGAAGAWPAEATPLPRSLSTPAARSPAASPASPGLVALLLQAREYQRVRALLFEVLASARAPSEALALGAMTACAATGAWTEAVQALRALLRTGLEGGAPVGAAVVAGCLQALARAAQLAPAGAQLGIANAALQVFCETQGVRYEAQTYLVLIQVFAATGNPQQVVAVHELMLREGRTPDAGGALVILQSMLQLGEVSKAACLAQSMVSQGFQLDADTLVGLVTACGHAGVWEPAQTLCAVAHSMQLPCAASAFNVLLNAAVGAGKYGVVTQILGAMQAGSVAVDPGVLASVMSQGAPAREEEAAPAPAAPAEEADAPAPVSGASSPRYASIAEANAELESRLEALDLHGMVDHLRRVRDSGLQADEATYRLLIRSAVRANQPHLAVQLCSQAHSSGVLRRYFLPHEPSGPLINLRAADRELAATVVLTWLSLLAQLPEARAAAQGDTLSIIGGHEPADAEVQDAIRAMLTSGEPPVEAFRGLVPVSLPANSISSVPGLMTVPMKVIFGALM